MGEFADYALEEVFEHEEMRAKWKAGEISIEKAIDQGVINEQGFELDPNTGGSDA